MQKLRWIAAVLLAGFWLCDAHAFFPPQLPPGQPPRRPPGDPFVPPPQTPTDPDLPPNPGCTCPPPPQVTPEPASLLLGATGALTLASLAWKRRRQTK